MSSSTSEFTFKPYVEKEGEEYMNDAQLQHFSAILNKWKSELMQEVDRTVHHMQDEAANFPDPNDRATQESEFSLELRTRDRERRLIKKIDESLKDIESGDYGFSGKLHRPVCTVAYRPATSWLAVHGAGQLLGRPQPSGVMVAADRRSGHAAQHARRCTGYHGQSAGLRLTLGWRSLLSESTSGRL